MDFPFTDSKSYQYQKYFQEAIKNKNGDTTRAVIKIIAIKGFSIISSYNFLA